MPGPGKDLDHGNEDNNEDGCGVGWVRYGDVTYIWITDRFWYLATVVDAATKELVG